MVKKASPKKAQAKDKQDAKSPPLQEREQKDFDGDDTKDGQCADQSQPNHEDQSPQAVNASKKHATTQDESALENKKKRKAECSTGKADAVGNDKEEDRSEPEASTSNENDEADSHQDPAPPSAESGDKPAIDLTKPIKKARTAFFIFSDERRAEIRAKNKGEGVAVVARELGQTWAAMTAEDKAVYQEKAAMEREQVAQQLEQLKDAGIDLAALPGAAMQNEASNPNALVFPLARMKKICKLDPEVKGLSKEALLLVTKCAELAMGKLGIEAVRVAQIQNRRTLLPDDVAQVCQIREQFLFLRDDVKDLVREQVVQKQKDKESNPPSASSSKAAKAASNTKPLTAFFAVTSSEPRGH